MCISIGYSQKCDVKNDPITGEKTCKFMNKQQTLRFEYKGGDIADFYTTFSYSGEQNTVIPKGSEIIFKFNDGKILKLYSVIDATPQTKVYSSSTTVTVITNYTYAFKMTREEIAMMASSKIDLVRYPAIEGGHMDYDVKGLGKIYANKITNGAECILSNWDTLIQ